jgi:hypothetical protein
MELFFRWTVRLLVALTWLSGAVLIGIWSQPGGIAFVALGALLLARAVRRGTFTFTITPTPSTPQLPTEREAKYMVTQILKNLTRVQVAYLCQDFKNRTQARTWLKQALPKLFHQELDSLQASLETAKLGTAVPGLKLVQLILSRKEHLQQLEDALRRAQPENAGYQLAHPMIFVVTEHLDAVQDQEPRVITLAAWNPSQPTLLPQVDAVTIFSEGDKGKLTRGHALFAQLQTQLAGFIHQVEGQPHVYTAEPVGDIASHGVEVQEVPMGFVIGTAEFL